MEVANANVVFQHGFDATTIEEIENLRAIRLNYAEKMLQNVESTARELEKRGKVDENGQSFKVHEIRTELANRVAMLRERLDQQNVIFADEIEMYVDILKGKKDSAR